MASLRVGRPATLAASLSLPRPGVASCVLAPRPHGDCVVHARFHAPSDLRCSVECRDAVRAP